MYIIFRKLKFFIFLFFIVNSLFSQEKQYPLVKICPIGSQQLYFPNWESCGPINDIKNSIPNVGYVSSIAMDRKNNQIVYLASNTGGLYKTENFLDSLPTWKCISCDLKWHGLGVNDIVLDNDNPEIVYLATGFNSGLGNNFGFGVMKSIDGGKTWKSIGPGLLKKNNLSLKIKINYNNSNELLLAQNDKLFKYNVSKNEWETLFVLPSSVGLDQYHPGSNCRKIVDIEQSLDNDKLWIITTDYSGNKSEKEHSLVFISVNNGKSWNKINLDEKYKSDKIVVSCSKRNPKSIYLNGTYNNIDKKLNLNFIISSVDNGKSWNLINNIPISGTGFYRQEFEFSELSNSIYIGGYYVNYSNDNGKNFNQNSKNVHVDCRSLNIVKINDTTEYILSGNDGGISLSKDFGLTWINKNGSGLNIKQFFAIGTANNTSNLFAGGTQDNDIAIFDGNWSSPQLSNDGAEVIIDKIDNQFIYAQPFCCDPSQLKVRKYQKKQNQWKVVESISPPEKVGNSLRPFKQFDDGSLLIGYHDLWKSERNKLKWKKISSFSSDFIVSDNNAIKDIAIDESDTNKIITIFEGPAWSDDLKESYFFLSNINKKGERTWTDLTNNLPPIIPKWLALSCVEIDKNNNNIFYLGTSELLNDSSKSFPYNGQMRVVRSLDNGITWEDYSNNLPPFKVNRILSQKGVNGSIYLATDVGVFYTNEEIYKNNGWICINENMPVSIATDLEINYCEGNIYCSTFGYGIWKGELFLNEKSNKLYFEITKNQSFYGDKILTNNIKILKNKTLTLKDGVFSIPAESEILMEKGSKLILDNAKIVNNCSKKWNGIIKNKNSKIILLNNSSILID